MNERIRELAKESDLDWHKHWNDDESNRLEKFAELIVRECAEQIRMHAEFLENEYPNKYFDVTAVNCAELIEEHFGVEE